MIFLVNLVDKSQKIISGDTISNCISFCETNEWNVENIMKRENVNIIVNNINSNIYFSLLLKNEITNQTEFQFIIDNDFEFVFSWILSLSDKKLYSLSVVNGNYYEF